MNKTDYISILEQPTELSAMATHELKRVVQRYPYFQSARALYLKALKTRGSFLYNNQLKKTAVYSADREVLFDFITSDIFEPVEIVNKQPSITESKPVSKSENQVDKEPAKLVTEQELAGQKLELGKPLSFSKSEKHSFGQWLQLVQKQPVDRSPKSEQENIIDKFIASNPKIPRIDKHKPVEVTSAAQPEKTQLMTETLAKVYLEQKKYDSAIKAYQILSLKYPEKSSFFADRINQIKILQKHK